MTSNSLPSDPPQSFEESLSELEGVVRGLEDGALGLDDALLRYERGVALVRQCYGRLRQAEQRISQLGGMESGQPLLQPFAHESTATRPEPVRRVRKRGTPSEE